MCAGYRDLCGLTQPPPQCPEGEWVFKRACLGPKFRVSQNEELSFEETGPVMNWSIVCLEEKPLGGTSDQRGIRFIIYSTGSGMRVDRAKGQIQ